MPGKNKTAPAKIIWQGLFRMQLFFAGAATAGRFFTLLFLHGSCFSAFRAFLGFASSFLGGATFLTFKYSHFALLLINSVVKYKTTHFIIVKIHSHPVFEL